MDILVKDEPLDLDFNLKEQFKSNDPKNDAVIGEISALVKEAQIFLQESEYEMKNMQDCFEKMKKRHTENIIITFKILQLLTTYNVLPVAINQDNVTDEFVNPPLEIIDNERSPDTISVESANTKSQTDKAEIMEFSVSERPSNYISKNDTDERSENNQKKLEYKNLSSKGQATKHSLPGETCNFQLDDEVGSEMIDVDVVSVDSRTENCANKTSNTTDSNVIHNSRLEDSGGSTDHGIDTALIKKQVKSNEHTDNIGTVRRKARRERPCRNCPICPKVKKVVSDPVEESRTLPFPDVASIGSKSNESIKIKSHRKLCPLKGCEETREFKRLDSHLIKKHNLSADSETYYQILCDDALQQSPKETKNASPSLPKKISSEKSQVTLENSAVEQEANKAGSSIYHSKLEETSPASFKDITSNISQDISNDRSSEISPVNMENPSGEAGSSNTSSSVIPRAEAKLRAHKPHILEHFSFRSRKTFNSEERDLIVKTFQEFIDKNCLPSLPVIRQYMTKNGPLKTIVNEKNYQPSQVKGCLLNIINKKKKSELFFGYALLQCQVSSERNKKSDTEENAPFRNL